MKMYNGQELGPSEGKSKHNRIPTEVTPPDAKGSWDSKHPDSSFSKKELSEPEAGPEFASGNSSTFRETVKG